MGKIAVLLILIGFLFYGATGFCDPVNTDLDFSLPAPETAPNRSYLGLETREPFFLGQVKAEILIIEIFSMYCPICQREAADVNKLFDLIQKDPALKPKIKLIGIGAGNSSFEVNFFKEKYQIEFPLFSDGKFVIHKKIGEVGTPYFIGLKPNGKKSLEIFYSQSGEMTDPADFLRTLIKASGLKL
jgi:peroxiredoxin